MSAVETLTQISIKGKGVFTHGQHNMWICPIITKLDFVIVKATDYCLGQRHLILLTMLLELSVFPTHLLELEFLWIKLLFVHDSDTQSGN
jgi:hypothetical protein